MDDRKPDTLEEQIREALEREDDELLRIAEAGPEHEFSEKFNTAIQQMTEHLKGDK